MKFGGKITATSAPPSVVLIRLTVGAVFLSEGIQKFLSRQISAWAGSQELVSQPRR